MSQPASPDPKPYRVLARKYRPQNFDELIGQDPLVRTLKNAISSGRIAHAFMLTGVRGVGKTTTARIIAKALNYTGPDAKAGPTTGSTDDCQLCKAISEDRHPDVIEMDAASRTGVDDIREILDGVRYAPTEARYKIYIIDEVHMLSKNAFNALLKTLEEPPPHVKFIFATTEIRKVPVTVLSRCQRFDLRRVDMPTLIDHFRKISAAEKIKADDEALTMIARAADGSVRDGLSLLDQAIALGQGNVTGDQVQSMLGLGDRLHNVDLFEFVLGGELAQALSILDDLHRGGGDPVVLIQDLLDITHILTRLRAVPALQSNEALAGGLDARRLSAMAQKLPMGALSKSWQILLKGLAEVQMAPDPRRAAEMIVMRLAYAAELPDPVDLVRTLKNQPADSLPSTQASLREPRGGGRTLNSISGSASAAAVSALPETKPVTSAALHTLEDVVALLNAHGEVLLASQIYQYVHLIRMEAGRLEIRPAEMAPPTLSQDLGRQLSRLAGARWMVSISKEQGQMTLAAQAQAVKNAAFTAVLQAPEIQDILQVFPDAQLTDIKYPED
ncbi:MAG: DNA polymerase III subunit gamma/tau [Alphaproteobacteria bacterium]